jgi:hypothetical protein
LHYPFQLLLNAQSVPKLILPGFREKGVTHFESTHRNKEELEKRMKRM